jgi:hypothetical protein
VLVKEAGGAAQRGFVEMVAQVGDHAEAGVVHQVGAEVVAKALEPAWRPDQRKGHHVPGIVHVQKWGTEDPQVEVPWRFWEAEKDGPFGRIGPQNLVEDGLKEKGAKGIKHAHHGQQQHPGSHSSQYGSP